MDPHTPAPPAPPAGDADRSDSQRAAAAHLRTIASDISASFQRGRRVLSFGAYLDAFAKQPRQYGRNAAEYVCDAFAHYGRESVPRPWGETTRFKLFDAPWNPDDPHEPRLSGHEALQANLFRVLSNFAREGHANRLVLMHGPNGSAKSTAAACITRALEHYSTLPEGALYRFHWVFPSRKKSKGSIGFGASAALTDIDSYATLDDEDIDTRLVIELRDHPLFLLPVAQRQALIDELWHHHQPADANLPRPNHWLYRGQLCHKNKQIFEALLAQYRGSLPDVLRHVQVERYFISHRYRVGAVTLGPEMSVDARERQVTADRSLAALPTSLQATTLFEAYGELVDAAGGVLELSDLLKRPLDAFRYLQISLETGSVSLPQQVLFTNLVLLGSANEIHLAAFREHAEFASFRGRIELLRVPYLRQVDAERTIYDRQIVPQLRRHVAPHTTQLAAEFAVLTRLLRPDPNRYEGELADMVGTLTVEEKLDLYNSGLAPDRLPNEQRKWLRANVHRLYHETDNHPIYEGAIGLSPRIMRALLLDSAQHPGYACVSPFALLEQLAELTQKYAASGSQQRKPHSGGYQDHAGYLIITRRRLLNRIENDLRSQSGLIDKQQYETLFRRYITHVSAWVKNEKLHNDMTGRDEDADEGLMKQVEELLGATQDGPAQRHATIGQIAAWAIDHPGEKPQHQQIFPHHVERMQAAAFNKLRRPFAQQLMAIVALLRQEGSGMDDTQKEDTRALLARLATIGYNHDSAADAASALLRERYADLMT